MQENLAKPIRLAYEIPQTEDALELNLISPCFNRFSPSPSWEKMGLIIDVEKFLKRRKYHYSNDIIKKRSMTLAQAIATFQCPSSCGENFFKRVKQIKTQWGDRPVKLSQIKEFYAQFSFGIRIFIEKRDSNGEIRLKKVFDSYWSSKMNLIVKFLPSKGFEMDSFVTFMASDEILMHYFECENKYCLYTTNRRHEFERHQKVGHFFSIL